MTLDTLKVKLAEQGKLDTPPTIQLRADKDSRYDTVAQVLAAASDNQLTNIAFVSE